MKKFNKELIVFFKIFHCAFVREKFGSNSGTKRRRWRRRVIVVHGIKYARTANIYACKSS